MSKLKKLCKKFQKFVKLPCNKIFFLDVKRKGTYFIWVWSKTRRVELKQWVKVSFAKYVGMFHRDCSYNSKFIFTDTKLHVCRIPNNQSIPNTPSRCLNFSFPTEGLSIAREIRKICDKKLHCRLILETIFKIKMKSMKHEMKNLSHCWF